MTLSATPTVEPFLRHQRARVRVNSRPRPGSHSWSRTSNETGRDEVFVRTFPGGGNRQVVSSSGGQPEMARRWTRAVLRRLTVLVMSVTFTDVGPGTPTPLFAVPAGLRREMPQLLGRLPRGL
jgi:hypothetical protein